jgi:hypothetical protein
MEKLGYPVGTRVRVTADVGEAPQGVVGVVIGHYRCEPPAYAVAVRGTPVTIPPARLQPVGQAGSGSSR